MPRNSTPVAQDNPETPESPVEETPAVVVDPLEGLSDDNKEPFVDTLLTQAQTLQAEKDALFGRIGANRDTLRTIQKTGALSEKQAKAIDLFYPIRQKKAGDTAPAA